MAAVCRTIAAAIAGLARAPYFCAVTKPCMGTSMASETIAVRHYAGGGEVRAVGLVSAAHFVSHFQMLVVPPLFLMLQARWGVGFVALALSLTVYAIVSVVAQLPMGWLTDRFGSRRLLISALFVGGAAIASIGIVDRYWWMLAAY